VKNSDMIKRSDILISNYRLFLCLLLGTIILGFASELNDYLLGVKNAELISVFQIGVLGSIFSFFTYGIFVWPVLLVVNLLIERIGLNEVVSYSDCKKLFIIEVILVVFVSFYLSTSYHYFYWLFLIPICSAGQFFRLKF
jgi:hypothetical protein